MVFDDGGILVFSRLDGFLFLKKKKRKEKKRKC